jgi:hypothetical protein
MAALISAIAFGFTGAALVPIIAALLVAAGIVEAIAWFIAGLAAYSLVTRPPPFVPGPATRRMTELVPYYRAWYIVNAARRLEKEPEGLTDAVKAREVRYYRWHLYAMDNRLATAEQVDEAAQTVGTPMRSGRVMLGWKATMDGRTTNECRAANGRNFYADRPPRIGYPGMVHPHCRCRPVAPFPGAPLVR